MVFAILFVLIVAGLIVYFSIQSTKDRGSATLDKPVAAEPVTLTPEELAALEEPSKGVHIKNGDEHG